MTTEKTISHASDTAARSDELQTVIDLVLRQEQDRKQHEEQRRSKRLRKKRKAAKLADARLVEAIHVIKWCVVGICSAMVVAVVIGIWALIQVERAVADVERDVEQITTRVDGILHEIEHPFEGVAKKLGRNLDQSAAAFFGLTPPEKKEN